jgi:hypothetical protein
MWLRIPIVAGLLVTAACGGDGDGGTGPGGGSLAGTYELVGINEDGLPEDEQIEGCTWSTFTGGSIVLNEGGTWQFTIAFDDETGEHLLQDNGQYRRDGLDLEFASAQFGDEFEGEIEGDLVVLYYDFCANGVADIDFVFEK